MKMPMDEEEMDIDGEALRSIAGKARGERGQALLTVILGGSEEPDMDEMGGAPDADEDDLMP